ncbi:conserved hypothetical protein [Culex quinquefasciatus]|uniref:Uncharacterized protein n=1 Tax=Culex quinquefasciatus TaxID=7176 RepID=B0X8S4_CULQU|nr:conserved hypothetical protein [Culex quinquefasciatus]|eukprot:XP_001866046.1 conserved hypothetical protein [Culex quinquefasciatus]
MTSHRTGNPSKQRKKWANRTLILLCIFKIISLYFMFRQQFNFSPRTSCVLSILLGALFTGLSFVSTGFQCITLLMVPQMLSKRGRIALIAYVFVLALSGPARNTVENIGLMSESLICSQAQLKVSIHETLKALNIPFATLKETVQKLVAEVERGFMKIQRVLDGIMDGLLSTLETIRAGYRWLAELVTICNGDGKTSFERCIATLETSVLDCQRRLRFLGFMCNVKRSAKLICFSAKVIDWSIHYKTNYLSRDDYDNCYIGQEFYAVDKRRESMQLPRVLPLTRREQNCYIPLTSLYLLRQERLRIARNAFFLFLSTIQIAGIVSADYCLYWLLTIVGQASRKQTDIHLPTMFKIHVIGNGTIADMYRRIVAVIETSARLADYLRPAKCAPDPPAPDYVRYCQIGFLLISAWAFIVLEPYGLRVRQLIMAGYYPERARERATWLYNDIMLKRETFVKLVLKQMAADLGDPTGKPTWLDVIRAKTNHYWLSRMVLGSHHPVRCILCGSDLARDDYVRCFRPRCSGMYCYECFLEIQHVCWMCGDPILTGDSSDESLER